MLVVAGSYHLAAHEVLDRPLPRLLRRRVPHLVLVLVLRVIAPLVALDHRVGDAQLLREIRMARIGPPGQLFLNLGLRLDQQLLQPLDVAIDVRLGLVLILELGPLGRTLDPDLRVPVLLLLKGDVRKVQGNDFLVQACGRIDIGPLHLLLDCLEVSLAALPVDHQVLLNVLDEVRAPALRRVAILVHVDGLHAVGVRTSPGEARGTPAVHSVHGRLGLDARTRPNYGAFRFARRHRGRVEGQHLGHLGAREELPL